LRYADPRIEDNALNQPVRMDDDTLKRDRAGEFLRGEAAVWSDPID
jgi:hypothetical protein